MPQIARDLTRYNHHGAPCTTLANRVARTAASVTATVFGAACLTILCLTVLAPLFRPLVSSARAESRDIVVFGSIALKEALNEANDYFLSENGTRAVTTYGACPENGRSAFAEIDRAGPCATGLGGRSDRPAFNNSSTFPKIYGERFVKSPCVG